MNTNPWRDILTDKPPHGETLEWWYEYDDKIFTGELFHYDGKYVRISMRHWYVEEALYEFTHWRIPEPELEYPKRTMVKEQS